MQKYQLGFYEKHENMKSVNGLACADLIQIEFDENQSISVKIDLKTSICNKSS